MDSDRPYSATLNSLAAKVREVVAERLKGPSQKQSALTISGRHLSGKK